MLSFASTNAGKQRELQLILQQEIALVDVEIDEIQSMDVGEVARRKAEFVRDKGFRCIIIDDTSLAIDSLGGLPGPFVTWFLQLLGVTELARLATDAKGSSCACLSTCLGYVAENGEVTTFQADLAGMISPMPRGENGFGFDQIFVPEGEERTLAEMSTLEKQVFNPRRQALEKLADFLG